MWSGGLPQFRDQFAHKARSGFPFELAPDDIVKCGKNTGLLTNFDRHGGKYPFKRASGLRSKTKCTLAYCLRISDLFQSIRQLARTIAEIQFLDCSAKNLFT